MDANGGTDDTAHVPDLSQSSLQLVLGLLEQYGWFVLLGGILLYILWRKLEPKLHHIQERIEERNLKKYDSDTAHQRVESMQRARQRLQDQYDAQARLHAEKQKKKEEEKRQERIEDWDRHLEGKGYRNKFKAPTEEEASTSTARPKKKMTLRPSDYNPLMGAGGGGGGYRPPPRSSGGG